ncbi:MAG: endonuclease domain-containing protein [Stenotrophobium sp.]
MSIDDENSLSPDQGERAGVRGRSRRGKGEKLKLAKALRKRQTDAEFLLWQKLRNRQLAGCKFRRQYSVGPFIVDFACIEAKLVIELDGGQHVELADQDQARTEYLQRCGFRVIRFWNDQVFKEAEGVLQAVLAALTPHPDPLP